MRECDLNWREFILDWSDLHKYNSAPTFEEVLAYVGEAGGYLAELSNHLEETYGAIPRFEYSNCSAQPGWNIKYSKGCKSICTIYPMEDYFIVLVVIGPKDEAEVELVVPSMTAEIQIIYSRSKPMKIGRWLMIDVRDRSVLNDIKDLIAIRMLHK
jgi:hypothetical protein